MAYEYEKENISKIDHFNIVTGSNNISKPSEELKEAYRKAKAWDNYVDSVRSLVSKHADEDTDIEKEVRDILCVYLEDE